MAIKAVEKAQTLDFGMESFDVASSVPNIAEFFAVHDTGLQPTSQSGVILHRVGLGSEQIVYQYAPHFRVVGYKEHEGSSEMETYELPFPYWIVCISYEGGVFQGVRHFYSTHPIYSLDDPLLIPNLPNTNTRGYNNTSVGWVCLYHQKHEVFKDLASKLNYALAQHDPMGVPYNYGNMSSTDGYTTYKKYRTKQTFLYDPAKWQKKGQDEGLEWTLQEDLWMPFQMDFDKHPLADRGIYPSSEPETPLKPYTLQDAIYGDHFVYYDKRGAEKLNEYTRSLASGDKEATGKMVATLLRTSIVTGSRKVEPSITVKQAAPSLDRFMSSFTDSEIKARLGLIQANQCFSCLKDSNHDGGRSNSIIVFTKSMYIEYANIDYSDLKAIRKRIAAGIIAHGCISSPGISFLSDMGKGDASCMLDGAIVVDLCLSCYPKKKNTMKTLNRALIFATHKTDVDGFPVTKIAAPGTFNEMGTVTTACIMGDRNFWGSLSMPDNHPYRKFKKRTSLFEVFTATVDDSFFSSTRSWRYDIAPKVVFSLAINTAGIMQDFTQFTKAADFDMCSCGTLFDKESVLQRDWMVFETPVDRSKFSDNIPLGISKDLPGNYNQYHLGCVRCIKASRFNPVTGVIEHSGSSNFLAGHPNTSLDPLTNYRFTPLTFQAYKKAYGI